MWPTVAWCAYKNLAGLELGPGLGIKWLGVWQVSEFCHCGSQVLLAKVSAGVEMTVCECVCVCVYVGEVSIRQHSYLHLLTWHQQ